MGKMSRTKSTPLAALVLIFGLLLGLPSSAGARLAASKAASATSDPNDLADWTDLFFPSTLKSDATREGVYRFLQADQCDKVLASWSSDEVKDAFDVLLGKLDVSFLERLFLKFFIKAQIRFGVEVRTVCGNCVDHAPSYPGCSSDYYGYQDTYSGLAFVPLESDGTTILARTLVPVIHMHGTNTDAQPSTDWDGTDTTLQTLMNALITAIKGTVNILPDYMGYGVSTGEAVRGYLVKDSYWTSTFPLIGSMQNEIATRSNCQSTLAKKAIVYGYSEGGYATIAVADGLDEAGYSLLRVDAGGGPYDLQTTFFVALQRMQAGTYPLDTRYFVALIGSAYSEYPDTPLAGQDILKSEVHDTIVNLVNSGASADTLNQYISARDPTDIFVDELTTFFKDAVASGNDTPCDSPQSGIVQLLCDTLEQSNLTPIIYNANYPIHLCQSKDDRIIAASNVPSNVGSINGRVTTEIISGEHTPAGVTCLKDALLAINGMNLNVADERGTCTVP